MIWDQNSFIILKWVSGRDSHMSLYILNILVWIMSIVWIINCDTERSNMIIVCIGGHGFRLISWLRSGGVDNRSRDTRPSAKCSCCTSDDKKQKDHDDTQNREDNYPWVLASDPHIPVVTGAVETREFFVHMTVTIIFTVVKGTFNRTNLTRIWWMGWVISISIIADTWESIPRLEAECIRRAIIQIFKFTLINISFEFSDHHVVCSGWIGWI